MSHSRAPSASARNRLDEFRYLAAHIRPDLAARMEPGAGMVGD